MVWYLLMKSIMAILIAYPCFLILIASSMPAHRSYLQTSWEFNSSGEKFEFGLMHLMYLGLDSCKVWIKEFSCSMNWLDKLSPPIWEVLELMGPEPLPCLGDNPTWSWAPRRVECLGLNFPTEGLLLGTCSALPNVFLPLIASTSSFSSSSAAFLSS